MLVWLALAVVLFFLYRAVFGQTEPEIDIPAPIVFQKFTPKTLAKYNGRDDPHVLMAVKGKVYDVTPGKAHYGPGGMYENFAGRDASRGLAKHSFETDMLTPLDEPIDELADLDAEERAALDQWAEFFGGKYVHVGDLST